MNIIAALLIAASPITMPHYVPEDSPAFDCRVDGNRICGPANDQHVAAGCYSDTGALVAAWPCRVVINRDGTADVYR